MGWKEFAMRNKGPIGQMAVAALFILLGVAMLQMSYRPPQLPEYGPEENQTMNTSNVRTSPPVPAGPNCTPLFNKSRKMSYGYDVEAPSPEGYMVVSTSYDYVGEEIVDGIDTYKIQLRANSTFKDMVMNPVYTLWLDSETGSCVKAQAELEEGYVLPMECKDAKFSMPAMTCQEQLMDHHQNGTERVKVPAGEFQTIKYVKGDETVWIAQGIPVPVKFTFKSLDSYASAQLTYYREK